MALSDGTEETTYLKALQRTIERIDQLARWGAKVVTRVTLQEVLAEKFDKLLIGIYGTAIEEEPHAFGKSGQMNLSSYILVIIDNARGGAGSVPQALAGQTTSADPSLAVVDGALRNALDMTTLDGFIIAGMNALRGGDPVEFEEPDNAVARLYLFTAFKEIERS